ncbi:MAG TPA: DUF2905 domain-containing protein [Kiritimatiellae bacterium]|nr:DUF2905 domain-containing protein [Kiritimatiellia bacterium]
MGGLGRLLIAAGLVLVLVGLMMLGAQRLGFLSWLGRLPGDIRLEGRNWSFYFPFTTSILLSALLTLLVALARLFWGR